MASVHNNDKIVSYADRVKLNLPDLETIWNSGTML